MNGKRLGLGGLVILVWLLAACAQASPTPAPSRYAPIEIPTYDTPPLYAPVEAPAYEWDAIRLSPEGSIRAAAFFEGTFAFISMTSAEEEYALALHLVDLETLKVTRRVLLEKGPSTELRGGCKYRMLGYDGTRVYYEKVCDRQGTLYIVYPEKSMIVETGLNTEGFVAVEDGIVFFYKDFRTVEAVVGETGEVLWKFDLNLVYPLERTGETIRHALASPIGAWTLNKSLVLLVRDVLSLDTDERLVSYWLIKASPKGMEQYSIEGPQFAADFSQDGVQAGFDGEKIYLLEWSRYSYGGEVRGFAQVRVVNLEGRSSVIFYQDFTDDTWPDRVYLDLVMGNGGVGIGYYAGNNTVTFYTITDTGEAKLLGNLRLLGGTTVLGFTGKEVFYIEDFNLYRTNFQGPPELLARLPSPGLEVLVSPLLAPGMLFMPKSTNMAHIEDSTLYIYLGKSGELRKLEIPDR